MYSVTWIFKFFSFKNPCERGIHQFLQKNESSFWIYMSVCFFDFVVQKKKKQMVYTILSFREPTINWEKLLVAWIGFIQERQVL